MSNRKASERWKASERERKKTIPILQGRAGQIPAVPTEYSIG